MCDMIIYAAFNIYISEIYIAPHIMIFITMNIKSKKNIHL